MKRFLYVLLSCCLLCSTAFAVPDRSLTFAKYRSYTSVYAAPELSTEAAVSTVEEGNKILAVFEHMSAGFIFTDSGTVESGAVYTNEDEAASDFLAECMAMIAFLGEIDFTAYGMLLNQYMSIKADRDSSVYYMASGDAFQVIKQDPYKYMFIYLNQDGVTN